jgi:hypothetical protein
MMRGRLRAVAASWWCERSDGRSFQCDDIRDHVLGVMQSSSTSTKSKSQQPSDRLHHNQPQTTPRTLPRAQLESLKPAPPCSPAEPHSSSQQSLDTGIVPPLSSSLHLLPYPALHPICHPPPAAPQRSNCPRSIEATDAPVAQRGDFFARACCLRLCWCSAA